MTNLTQPLHDHHKHCDELFATAEADAHGNKWDSCQDALTHFREELEAHFSTEEQVLFPAFEAATGMAGGPTQMMRFEHTQMRDLVGQLSAALDARDRDVFAGTAETLLIMMQQHNMKEENILYPMCDRSLPSGTVDVAGALKQRLEAECLV